MMKRIVIILLLGGLISGCGIIRTNESYSFDNIQMSVDNKTISNKGLDIIIVNNSDTIWNYGEDYGVQIFTSDEWLNLSNINPTWAIETIEYSIKAQQQTVMTINWENRYGQLERGKYRIVKSFRDARGSTIELYSEFEN